MAGHAIIFGGGAVSWSARKLKIVPLSSAEAEAAVLSLACKDMMYVKQLLNEIRDKKGSSERVRAFTDNEAFVRFRDFLLSAPPR